ncbi:MAG: hypothetical protein KF819_05565 [Labilithrix sp.]|nr:hypothetical protein [Labilithrix sp.]
MRRWALSFSCLLFGACGVRVAHADPPRALDPRVLSSSPESATTSLAWRSQLRGRVGVPIPIYGDTRDEGFALKLPAFIELHNYRPAVVPNQLWRGRLWIDASYGWALDERERSPLLRVGYALEHESDHGSETHLGGFHNINAMSAHVDLSQPLGARTTLFATVQPRFHFLTCTQSPIFCATGGGGRGSRAFELSSEVSVMSELGPLGSVMPVLFASAFATWLPKSEYARLERRLTIDFGAAFATDRKGTFQIFGTALFGHDVGYYRGTEDVAQGGFGVRWTP